MVYPNIEWYTSLSRERELAPRCPFASVKKCPKYYESLSLLKATGATEIDPKEDERLSELWKTSDFWPQTGEQESCVWGAENKHISNFCPEVSFLRFGLFATDMHSYADEIDLNCAHSRLAGINAPRQDWRWNWADVRPMHYSECPLYSPLICQPSDKPGLKEQSKIFGWKITIPYIGISINPLALWDKIKKW